MSERDVDAKRVDLFLISTPTIDLMISRFVSRVFNSLSFSL